MSSHISSGEVRDQQAGVGQPADYAQDDALDLRELFFRVWRGMPQIFGLAMLGLVVACVGYLVYTPFQTVSTSTRVVFSFPGVERSQYPDGSKFQPDDLRAPDLILEALRRRGFDTSTEFQSNVRASMTVEGIIPQNVVRDRDRLRASGQTPPTYIPDEYVLTLSVPRNFQINQQQRETLLNELVGIYRENFRRTYADVPLAFGNAFAVLNNADYPDFEAVFERELAGLTGYLGQQTTEARLFRSPTTNLSFSDLLRQAEMFVQVRLSETLGLIDQNGLSRNRKIALVKMNEALRALNIQERSALDEESVVKALLTQVETRNQNYVLGVREQADSRANARMLDQGVVDSIIANDPYNFMIRRVLDASLQVKRVQADKDRLLAQREKMTAFSREDKADQSVILAETQKSIAALEASYQDLISNVRRTYTDYARQQFGDAIRLSARIVTSGTGVRPLLMPSALGLFLGAALGAGLSLLSVYIGRSRAR